MRGEERTESPNKKYHPFRESPRRLQRWGTAAQIKDFAKLNPLERLGQPEDIVGVASFLAGPDGAWVNSQVVRANGGFAIGARIVRYPAMTFKIVKDYDRQEIK